VCVYQPFYGGIFNADQQEGWLMQPNFSEETEDTCRSWGFWDGYWYNWAQFWGYPTGIGNLVFRAIGFPADTLCPTTGICDTLKYHHPVGPREPFYNLRCPDGRYGKLRTYCATKFTAPAAGQLKMTKAMFRNRVAAAPADVWFYVWNSDGKYPTTIIDSVYFGNPDTNQLTWHAVDFTSKHIFFNDGDVFHVGITSVNFITVQTNNVFIYADSGFKETDNSAQYFAYWFGTSPFWMTLNDNREYYFAGAQTGTEYFIEAEMCYTPLDYRLTITPPAPACHDHACGQASSAKGPATFNIDTSPIGGYSGVVNLSITGLPSGMTANFAPASGTPPFSSVLTVSVDATVAYDLHPLTVHATGPKGDRTRDVSVQVIPVGTYDEFLVDAEHCITRVTNFGAVANPDEGINFLWYEASVLFDGGIILATGPDKMAADIATSDGSQDTIGKWFGGASIFPIGSQTITPLPDYPEVYMAEAHWADAIGLHVEADEYTVGIVDPVGGGDFSMRAYNFTNEGTPDTFMMAYWFDYDVLLNAKNRGGYDSLHNMGWIYDFTAANKDSIFGFMRVPTDDAFCVGYKLLKQQSTIWHVSGSGIYHPDAWAWMNLGTWDSTYYAGVDTDWAFFFTPAKFALGTGESHHEVLLEFGKKNSEDMHAWRHRVLQYVGFYRGNVEFNDTLDWPAIDISDLVYLINYLYKDGPAPEPFADQGDVTADGIVDLGDVVHLIRYAYRGGPPPWDYIRFIPEIWKRTSLFADPTGRWR
jgi:hypothetical protein